MPSLYDCGDAEVNLPSQLPVYELNQTWRDMRVPASDTPKIWSFLLIHSLGCL